MFNLLPFLSSFIIIFLCNPTTCITFVHGKSWFRPRYWSISSVSPKQQTNSVVSTGTNTLKLLWDDYSKYICNSSNIVAEYRKHACPLPKLNLMCCLVHLVFQEADRPWDLEKQNTIFNLQILLQVYCKDIGQELKQLTGMNSMKHSRIRIIQFYVACKR